ncbi:MAG: bifunctional oligoribonuclease/PAP phosphatase NrnA [Bacteroidetes bacterium]|jgi:phosphoesterase RecJ-like protein|nr:bifunctional oligoribonuclease/PAP phosphatase NrnA [Bacteroidota bacterium]
MPPTSSDHIRFRELLSAPGSVVLTTHINPDGDGLGSELALAEVLRAQGASVRVVNHDAVPGPYRFLDPVGQALEQYAPEHHDGLIASARLIVVLDANQLSRLGRMEAVVTSSGADKVIIDHHPDPGTFASLTIVDTDASSTGEIVFRLLDEAGRLPLSANGANALYTAVMTDTGSFRFPKTDAELHRIVARLIDMGADPVSTYQHVFEEGPANRLQLLGEVLAGLQLAHAGRVCLFVVTRDMFRRTGTSEIDTDAFVPMTLTIGGVQIGLMFTELDDCIKVNFRSRGSVAVNRLAQAFGGNGHQNAAGARVRRMDLDTLRQDVIARALHLLT